MLKKPLSFIAYLIILIILGLTVRHFAINPMYDNPVNHKTEINSAPLFSTSLTNLQGMQQNLRQYQGKIIVLNFWATWCPPCRKEIPDFIALQEQYKAQGLQFIGIAVEDKEPVAEYIATTKINYPILLGGDNGITLAQQLGNSVGAVPYTLIVNRQGQIVYQHPGELSKEQLVAVITPLLN